MAIVVLLCLAAVAAVLIGRANRPYSVLMTGLNAGDMSSVLSYLNAAGVTDYKVSGSDTVLVPEGSESALKAQLLMEGYPASGFGYSMYLDNVGLLSTESERTTLYLFDLQDRLSAVVRCFDGVKDAKVTVAPGEDRRYVLSSDNLVEASASVLVTMQGAQKLSDRQAAAIRNLIGSAVQGLVIDNISIADTAGNNYAGGEDGSASGAASLKLALESQVNNNVRNNILSVLIPLFGAENLSVGVNSTVDVSRTYEDSVTYTQPDWAADGSTGGAGIIGTKIYDNAIVKDDGAGAGGVAGTQSNSDLNTYVEGAAAVDGTEQSVSTSGQIDYNVDTRHTQRDTQGGVITDVMVSVSINSLSTGQIDPGMLLGHVARAAGIGTELQGEKISILALPFYQRETTPPLEAATGLPTWIFYALAAGAGLVLLLTVVMLLLRRRVKNRALPRRESAPALAPAAPAQAAGADIMQVNTERGMELRKDIRHFAEENPEIAAQMVKNWLKESEESSGR